MGTESEDILGRRLQNGTQPINKLPCEILSRIFVAVSNQAFAQQGELTKDSYFVAQNVVPGVCSFWRDVAISNPALWTRIYIACPSHQQLALLYLNRSASRILKVHLDFRRRYWGGVQIGIDDHESQVSHVRAIIQRLLTQHLHRFQSLRIQVTRYEALVPFISIVNRGDMSALLFLSWERELIEDEMIDAPFAELTNKPCSLLGHSFPKLEELHFSDLPAGFLFDPPPRAFPNLISLSLVTGCNLPSPSRFADFLAVNTQLESLDLDTSTAPADQDIAPTTRCVYMPSLHSLTIRSTWHILWLKHIVGIIEAPKLYRLIMHAPPSDSGYLYNYGFAFYIDTRHRRMHPVLDPARTAKPFFPSLRELDVSDYSCERNMLTLMLVALPQITHICVSGTQVVQLCRHPPLLPNLVCIKVTQLDDPSSQLGRFIRIRAETGHPIRTVQVSGDVRSQVRDVLPTAVEVQLWGVTSLRL